MTIGGMDGKNIMNIVKTKTPQKNIIRKTESIIERLKKEKKLNENIEFFINNLTIEELIQLKLEISTKMVVFNKFYGYPLWALMPKITREALIKFTLSATNTRKAAASFLGIDIYTLNYLINKYKLFNKENIETIIE